MESGIEKFVFKHPSTCYVSGPTGCGKTSYIIKVLMEKDNLFDKSIDKIVWCYKIYQDIFEEVKEICSNIEFHEGICDVRDIKHGKENIILIIDDLMNDMNKEVAEIFTVHSHHMGISVFFLAQNLYPRNKFMRDVTLNTQYLILFEQRRDLSQLHVLTRQIFPYNGRIFLKVYIVLN